ncbi:hypothetical protein FA15DRAFT_698827 [Coprinopsis marcescibilis]|uniref:Rrp15p-domain-containing protein n=1 Tax=Coprinopsis marcescibilis TaxID=230819 RepID=A0A5C3LNQ7_COPMA|nr:hypothetical protein FA15DRAFT_698827 [Coprinopsis marcescibilis]
MPPQKRRKLSDDEEMESNGSNSADESHSSSVEDSFENNASGNESGNSSDDEIGDLKKPKSKKTLKRKLRATGAETFGTVLQNLLQTETPSSLPLSLKPSITRKHQDGKLELKAKKVLQLEKKEQEDKRRIKDVIGGWGGQGERALRKVAQRGVVKLFNAIQQSQATVVAAQEEAKAGQGSGKPRLAAPDFEDRGQKGKKKDNVIGRGKETVVDKDQFFNMIKSGGIVSKA